MTPGRGSPAQDPKWLTSVTNEVFISFFTGNYGQFCSFAALTVLYMEF